MKRRSVCFGLGSNVGDRLAHLRVALEGLRAGGVTIERVSSLYETPPWGRIDQPHFLNAAVCGRSRLSARELLRLAKRIEAEGGRDFAAPRWTARPIDVDILLIDVEIVEEPDLVVPHPLIAERAFVLVPLDEIAGGALEPVSGSSVTRLLEALPVADRVGVVRVQPALWADAAGMSSPAG